MIGVKGTTRITFSTPHGGVEEFRGRGLLRKEITSKPRLYERNSLGGLAPEGSPTDGRFGLPPKKEKDAPIQASTTRSVANGGGRHVGRGGASRAKNGGPPY